MNRISRFIFGQPEAARLREAFPKHLASAVDSALKIVPVDMRLGPTSHSIGAITIGGEAIRIPSRIYNSAPAEADRVSLPDLEKEILACIYTRHHDGHVRQRIVRGLTASKELWVKPFLLQLAGEYVVEIIQQIYDDVGSMDVDGCKKFAAENPLFFNATKRRAISYWACYYRSRFPDFGDYPAFQLLHALGLWEARNTRKLKFPQLRKDENVEAG
jgi:hypothetical protein